MKWKISFKFLLSAWIFSTVVTSCKEIDLTGISNDIAINESLIAPVGETTLNVNDLLIKLDDPTRVHPEGDEIFITYEDSVNYSFRNIDVTKFKGTTSLSVTPWSSSSSATLPVGTDIPISPLINFIDMGLNTNSSETIEKAEISTATLDLSLVLTPDIKNKVLSKITIGFPNNSVTKADGVTPLVISVTPNSSGVASITLKDFIINIPVTSHGIPVKVTIDAKTSSTVTVSSSSVFTCNMNFKMLDYKVLWGRFQPAANSKDSSKIALDLPTSLSGLNLKFANPTVTLKVKSNIGTALLFNVDYVRALDKNKVPIASAYFTGTDSYNNGDSRVFRLTRPNNPGEWATTLPIVLNKDNGATNRLFESGKIPAALEYQFSSGVGADPAPSFLVPNAGIKAHVHVEVPLQLNAGSSVEMTDSIKDVGANLTSSMKDVTIKTGTLVLDITNSFPAPVTFELVELKDAKGNPILKDLTKVYTIEAPDVSTTDGSVTKTKVQRLLIELKDGQFDEFKKLKNLKFKITLGDKTSTTLMHFSPANFIKVKAGVFANGTITGNIGSTNN
jgi:hypothetical protein